MTSVSRYLSASFSDSIHLRNGLAVLFGACAVALLAQISIRLPWTPVPITGQTFAVGLLGLLYGRNKGLMAFGLYLLLGFVNVPVFALGAKGLQIGPTFGYLVGMAFSVAIVGTLSSAGYLRSFWHCWAAVTLGSLCTFAFGLLVLSRFVPLEALLTMGFLPFLPGDLIKNLSASAIAWNLKLKQQIR